MAGTCRSERRSRLSGNTGLWPPAYRAYASERYWKENGGFRDGSRRCDIDGIFVGAVICV